MGPRGLEFAKWGAVDVSLLYAAALVMGPAAVLAPLPTAFATLCALALLRRRLRAPTLALAFGALLIATARSRAALNTGALAHERATELLTPPARCEAEGVVIRSPVVVRPRDPTTPSREA